MEKKILLAFCLLAVFMVSFIPAVSAVFDITIQGPLAATVDTTTWYGKLMDDLGFGETWAQALVSIFIFIIIMAGVYDILGLTAFESKWVKILIGIGIAGIVSVTGTMRAFTTVIFSIAGGVSAISIGVVIIIAAVAFMLLHFGVSKLAVLAIKGRGAVEAERAAARTRTGAAAMRGAREGSEG
ncbi:MAG: hypothetical protein AABX71_02235 [Nanoarchaeota archaeon]